MPTVLLTGATGFLGRACLAPLERRGFTVHGVARRGGTSQADLLDERAATALIDAVKPTHLLHLAWIATPGVFWTSPDNELWVRASLHLAREFHRAGGRRAVFAGSCAEYDWTEGICREEATPLRPTSPYGKAKHALQQALAAERLNHAWARLFFLYGPGEPPGRLIPSTIRALLEGREAECSEGSQRRDFMHVADAAEALAALVAADVQGPVNVGTGEAPAVRQVVSHIAGNRVRWGAKADEAPLVVADTARLRGAVDAALRFDWRTGLDDTLAWWMAREKGREAA